MPLKRKSFFERLTGVVNVDEEASADGVEDEDMSIPPVEEDSYETPLRLEVPVKSVHAPELSHDEDTGKLLVDMYESDGNLLVQAMIAGVTPENLQISITRDRLTIKGKREMPKDVVKEEYHASELYWGSFERVIDLPFEIDAENAEAVEKYGLLIVRLPRLDTNRIQELRVKSV